MIFLAATHGDKYRKPGTSMWEYFCKHLNGDVEIDMKKSFYCGDAAGRPKSSTRPKKDFTDTDLKFSLNVGIPFKTPEELFLEVKEKLPKI